MNDPREQNDIREAVSRLGRGDGVGVGHHRTMARITPYIELVGQERIAPMEPLPPRPGGRSPNEGRPIGEVRAHATDDVYRIPLPPRLLDEFARLPRLDAELRAHVEAGSVAMDVAHLRGEPADTRVRMGYRVDYTDEEIQLLGL